MNDPQNTIQLWRYLSGNMSVAAGDQPCNTGVPSVTRICFVNNTSPQDMRFFQSSTALTLPPGGFGSIVVAYIFAAPVTDAACAPPCDIKPGDATKLTNAGTLGNGTTVNPVDRMTGFLSWTDKNANGVVDQAADLDLNGSLETPEFSVVPKSLLGKAYTAQAVFDAKFLLPFAPDRPDFFLIPGDNQVAVLWQPSPTEDNGDPYFEVASDVASALYDPNYRQFDVEGYRVYRGRVDNPSSLTLIAEFDYLGTFISDYAGQVNPDVLCAPELAVTTSCPVTYDPIGPGLPRTTHHDVPLVGPIVQVKLGERVELASGEAILLKSDTALTGNAAGYSALEDTGVPFTYVDHDVRNNFRYFYAVTAFDINSWQSGPTNLESQRATKSVTPNRLASNYANSGTITNLEFLGRGVLLDKNAPEPTIDPTTGTFSGPAPPANGWDLGFGDFIAQVLADPGNFTVRLDSLLLGAPYGNGAGTIIPHIYWFSVPATGTTFSVAVVQSQTTGVQSGFGVFGAVPVDNNYAALYGGSSDFALAGRMDLSMDGAYYTSLYGRGCVNGAGGFDAGPGCAFYGSRWFDGPSPANNETFAHPNGGNNAVNSGGLLSDRNNAGALTGVVTIHNTQSYHQAGGAGYRPIEGIKSGAKRAADFNVYWGAGGLVDSVIDVTHNVVVPHDSAFATGGWGILNASETPPGVAPDRSYDQRAELTNMDMGCVEPFRSYRASSESLCGETAATAALAPRYFFSRTAIPGPVVIPIASGGSQYRNLANVAQPNNGFVMYVAGDWFTFELAGGAVPAGGTVWSLRAYAGAISGGRNFSGTIDYGPYIYSNPEGERTMSALGTEFRMSYDVTNTVNTATGKDLKAVHTVPDPYYVTNEFETTTDSKIIKFVNLPQDAIVRIYSASGVLVALLEHHSDQFGGAMDWDVRNRNGQFVASGVYFYHVESGDATRIGKMTIVNFAQ